MLEKQVAVDLIEVTETGVVQVRTKTSVLEDGAVLSASFHRHTVLPGDDYSKEDGRVRAVCAAVHTSDGIAAHQAAVEAERQKV